MAEGAISADLLDLVNRCREAATQMPGERSWGHSRKSAAGCSVPSGWPRRIPTTSFPTRSPPSIRGPRSVPRWDDRRAHRLLKAVVRPILWPSVGPKNPSRVQSAETRSISPRGSRMPHVGQDVFTIGHPKAYLWSFGQGVVSQIRPGLRVVVSRRDPPERDRDPDSSPYQSRRLRRASAQ
jgi:hypothetical protein